MSNEVTLQGMINIGEYNTLTIIRRTDFGFYLEDAEGDEVLLPNRYITEDMKFGDSLRVFIYNDSEDRIVATTEEPYATINEFAYLKVKEITNLGAFMDMGLQKDLLVPFRNQSHKMHPGNSYIVYVYLDNTTERIVGTDRLRKYISTEPEGLTVNDEVDLLIGEKSDLGYFTIVNQKYQGLLYHSELFKDIHPGEKRKGFIKQVRGDGKIDVTLEKQGYANVSLIPIRSLNFWNIMKVFCPLQTKQILKK